MRTIFQPKIISESPYGVKRYAFAPRGFGRRRSGCGIVREKYYSSAQISSGVVFLSELKQLKASLAPANPGKKKHKIKLVITGHVQKVMMRNTIKALFEVIRDEGEILEEPCNWEEPDRSKDEKRVSVVFLATQLEIAVLGELFKPGSSYLVIAATKDKKRLMIDKENASVPLNAARTWRSLIVNAEWQDL